MMQNKQTNRGLTMITILIFGMIAVTIVTALAGWFAVNYRANRNVVEKERAFHMAEAGIEYYRWYLAHNPDDFTHGTTTPQPYVFDFEDSDGNIIGNFSLEITPPETGSSIVTIDSTGTLASSSISKTIRAQLSKPSFSEYAFISDEPIYFSAGTNVYGRVHSNSGIRFDGVAYNLVTSAVETYDDPEHSGSLEWGVHTHASPVDPLPPTDFPDRTDVFQAGREVGVPAIDFDSITSDMADYKTDAVDDGHYYSNSGKQGYHIVLQTDNTYDLYKVTKLTSKPSNSCKKNNGLDKTWGDWGTWSIDSETLLGSYSMPNNGIIFLEDHVWVDGQIDGDQITIAASRFPDSPGNRYNIIVNNDLKYTNYDGTDAIALIAQDNILNGMESEDVLDIDAALVAQNGRVGRMYYTGRISGSKPGCEPYDERTEINIYGTIASNSQFGFSYTDGNGYTTKNIVFDPNLQFNNLNLPETSSGQYEILSWEEID